MCFEMKHNISADNAGNMKHFLPHLKKKNSQKHYLISLSFGLKQKYLN
jgi:hypothetical protein